METEDDLLAAFNDTRCMCCISVRSAFRIINCELEWSSHQLWTRMIKSSTVHSLISSWIIIHHFGCSISSRSTIFNSAAGIDRFWHPCSSVHTKWNHYRTEKERAKDSMQTQRVVKRSRIENIPSGGGGFGDNVTVQFLFFESLSIMTQLTICTELL
jgi:hypothetical protein